jgi:hypothetical protein
MMLLMGCSRLSAFSLARGGHWLTMQIHAVLHRSAMSAAGVVVHDLMRLLLKIGGTKVVDMVQS